MHFPPNLRAHHQMGVWLPVIALRPESIPSLLRPLAVIGIPHTERRLGIPYHFLFSIPYSAFMDFCFFFHRYCSAGCRFSCSYTDAEPQQDIYAKGDEYHKFRECAKEHWDSMRSYFQKAATAYSNGVKLDVVTYTTLMKALIRVDKFHKKTCAASHAISAWECGGYFLFRNR
uniref:DUF1771 domain-containing protein n=2 Tax=Gossypium raimondii TaxID=29730 RepID=A0A0D2VF53_GOSRA|nr:hypothetical protein B456_013G173700 [Gossypium raimondii]